MAVVPVSQRYRCSDDDRSSRTSCYLRGVDTQQGCNLRAHTLLRFQQGQMTA